MEPESPQPQQKSGSNPNHKDTYEYHFISVNNEPNSIVMLKQIRDVVPLLVMNPIFILLNCQKLEKKMKDEQLFFRPFRTIEQMLQHIQHQLQGEHIEVLAPASMLKELAQNIGRFDQIRVIHFDQQIDFKLLQALALSQKTIPFFEKLGRQSLDEVIENWKSKRILKNRLPNIINLNKDGWKASIQLKTMVAMLNQKNTNAKHIMTKFYELYAEIYGGIPKTFKPFADINQIIKLYTGSMSPENYLTNNLLRASKDPAEMYYCQPYFRELFEALKSLYQKQKSQAKYPIMCYRGGSASEEEIQSYKKNKGQIIQNLGFLSTSTKIQIGQKFAKNLMFVIKVQHKERQQLLDFGYAQIKEASVYKHEDEILFNPLNTFMIQKVNKMKIKGQSAHEDDRYIDAVYLTYGPLAQIQYRKKNMGSQLSNWEHKYAAQAQYFVKDLKPTTQNQGDAFLSLVDYLEGGLEYWQQQLKHQHLQPRQARILDKMGRAYKFKNNYDQSLNRYQSCLILTQQKKSRQYAATLNNIGSVYDKKGNYEDALDSYKQSLEIIQQVKGRDHILCAHSLNNIGIIQRKMGKYQEALQSYEESIRIKKENKNYSYVNTLNNIGIINVELGNYQRALQQYQECLGVYEGILGRHHPQCADILNNIGSAHLKIGNQEEALKNFQESLKIRKDWLGEQDILCAQPLNNMGRVFCKKGQYEEALKNYQQCLSLQKLALGDDHSDYLQTLNIIINIYEQKEAAEMFHQ